MFFSLVKNYLQVFFFLQEILVKMSTYVSPVFLLFYHDLTGYGFITLGLCQMQQQWVTQGVMFLGGIFEGMK